MRETHQHLKDKPMQTNRNAIQKPVHVFLAIISIACFAGKALAEPMTLEVALAAAYTSNPQLEAQRAALRATDEEVAKALAGWRPSLSANGSYGYQLQKETLLGPQSTGSIPQAQQVELDQPVFDGRTVPGVRHAKALVSAGRAQLAGTEATVLGNAANAYFSVLRDTEIVEAYQDDVRTLTDTETNVEQRLKLGELTKTDQSQAQARLFGSKIALVAAQKQLTASRASFEHLIGRPAETLADHALPALPGDYEAASKIANAGNPTLNQSRAQSDAAAYAVDTATGALLPTVSIQATYGRSLNEIAPGVSENGVSVLGRLSVPLYQGGAEEASIRQAKEQARQAQSTVQDSERQVSEDLTNAWQGFQASSFTQKFAEKQAEANLTAYQGSAMQARVGERSILDILNAEQELLQSKIDAITQKQNCIIAAYKVLSVEGRMDAKDLALPVALYDPQIHYDEDATSWFGFGD